MAKIIDTFGEYYAKDRKTWRKWLEKNHLKTPGIWLKYYKKDSGKARVPYADAVEEALCFGWIDSTTRSGDGDYYIQLFMPRKPTSVWSKPNKERVEKLIANGMMTQAGLEKIKIAKENGMWNKLNEVDSLTIPPDLQKAFTKNKKAKKYYETLKPSPKKYLLYWMNNAKREETRTKRIAEIIESLSQGKLPDRFIVSRPSSKS